MRILLPFFLLALGAVAHAQQQDRKLAERIMHPDWDMKFDAGRSSPGKLSSVSPGTAKVKDFTGSATFAAKGFYTKDFAGSKQALNGKSTYATTSADTKGRHEIPNANTEAPTKSVAVKESRDANKIVDTRATSDANRSFLVRGRSQDRFDMEKGTPMSDRPLGYSGNLKTMSIEEVRELLNKNK